MAEFADLARNGMYRRRLTLSNREARAQPFGADTESSNLEVDLKHTRARLFMRARRYDSSSKGGAPVTDLHESLADVMLEVLVECEELTSRLLDLGRKAIELVAEGKDTRRAFLPDCVELVSCLEALGSERPRTIDAISVRVGVFPASSALRSAG